MENKIMDNTRKKQLGIIITAVVIVVLAAVGSFYVYTQKQTEVDTLASRNMDLNELIEGRDSVVNELVTAFNDIENNLKFIKEKRKQLSIEQNEEGNIDQKQAILADISLMNAMLEESSKHIVELEKKLKNSGIKLNSFQQKIASLSQTVNLQTTEMSELRKVIEEKEQLVADLNQKVENMEFEIARQSDTLESKLNIIDQKTVELNTAHIAYGTYKELKEKGLLTKEGGFLWIGQNKTIQENFDDEYFTELNILETKTIPLHSKKAKIISEHPANSYTLVEEDGQVSYLQIEDPEEFWKISKYAVIEVK
ncbi:Cbp1 family collagen-binding glycoprotein adhesin [Sunxiuqinia sp. sy24]|uniref:Cbp1 family collagen-binding glycoprotein adhesin n=1 Tax=Sunxiuqinia sp. sy24 TaxID=3461495 RepID=UPI0040456062